MALQQKISSKAEPVRIFCRKKFPLTVPFLEKYLEKLFGNRTDIEDSLKRLDSLTQEEAQMSAAQVLKATHTVDETGRVRGVADIALSVGNRVAGVSDQVQGVSDRVQGVSDQVQGVGDQVQCVSDRVQNVGDQVQGVGDQVQGVSDQVQGVNDNLTTAIDGA